MRSKSYVQFRSGDEYFSPLCSLTTRGVDIVALVAECARLTSTRGGELGHAFAFFVGVCHQRLSENDRLWVCNDDKEVFAAGEDPPPNGPYFLVDCDTWQIQEFGNYRRDFSLVHRCEGRDLPHESL